jgi:actin-related protein 9
VCLALLFDRKHTLAASGPFHRASNDSPLLLTHPPTLSLAQQQRLAQTLFERLNFPAVQLVARPVASLFAMNAVSGIVVDIGLERTTISPVIDTACHLPGVIEVPLGAEDLERHLVEILRIQPSVLETLAGPLDEDAVPPPAGLPQDTDSQLLRLSRLLWRTNQLRPLLLGGVALPKEQEEEGVTDIAAALVAGREKALMADKAAKSHKSAARREEDAKKRAADDARKKALAEGEEEADVISIEFEGRTVDITFVRQRAAEPLFEPTLVGKTGVMGLGEAVWTSINTLPPHERLAVWEGVAVVGELARIKSVSCPPRLTSSDPC